MLANKTALGYTVCDQTLGILCHKVPREAAIVAIYSAVEDDPPIEQVSAMLDTKPSPSEWKTCWAAATAVELEILDERLDEVPTVQELTTIQSEVATLSEEMRQLRYDGYVLEIRDAKEQLEAERVRLVEVLADEFGLDFFDAEQQFNGAVIQQLRKSPLWDISMGRHIK